MNKEVKIFSREVLNLQTRTTVSRVLGLIAKRFNSYCLRFSQVLMFCYLTINPFSEFIQLFFLIDPPERERNHKQGSKKC